MALTRAFAQNSGTTPLDTRLMWMSNIQKNPDNSPRLGMLFGAIDPITSTTSMNVRLGDGATFVVSRSTNDGVNVLVNVGDILLALDAAPTANSRYDVVWVKQNDGGAGGLGDADSLPTFGKTTGQAVANPQVATTLASVPTGALPLAAILVTANAGATNALTITTLVQCTALYETPIRYRSLNAMKTDAPNVIEGAMGFVKGDGVFYLRAGVWRRLDTTNSWAIVSQTTATPVASGTAVGTFGGTNPTWQTGDTAFFDTRADGVVGPIKVTGWYEVTAAVNWSSSSTGERYVELMPNDSSLTPSLADRRAASGTSNQTVSGQIYLSTGDYIKLKGWQNSGGSLNYQSRLFVKLIAG